ncbi:MAG: hypothetical protein ACT4O5_08210 [Gammaproteobacteria bacterium]
MLERLLENWLDSAGERTYQRCFCQMLIGQGYRIIHNTEHTPLEHGKDIIAVSPEGKIVGFQLKGNPGKSLKPGQFDEIRGQLEQLATLALGVPGYEKKIPDECYLVTNGEIDEAVSLELQRLNAGLESRGHPPEKIKTIAKGTLLAWANSLGLSLWPSEVEDFANLIKLLNYSGDEIFPAEIFDPLLRHTLRLEHEVPAPELRRRVTSAAVITAVALNSFSRLQNHFAEITAWTMFAAYVIAAAEKNGLDFEKDCKEAVETARDAIYGLLSQLCAEIAERKTLAEGDPFSEFAFYKPRLLLLYALMAIYWMWSEKEGWKRPEHKAVIESLIPEGLPPQWLWGEAAIAHFLSFVWFRKRLAPSPAHDIVVARVLAAIMQNKLQEGPEHLASPYYTIEDVVRHKSQPLLGCDDPYEGDGFQGTSYVCEGLMACLVRSGIKEACRELWPDFTRINHERLVPDEPWRYGLFRTGEGATNATKIYPSMMEWTELQKIASEEDVGSDIPQALKGHPFLLLLFVNIFPFRLSFSAVKFLHGEFDTTPAPTA